MIINSSTLSRIVEIQKEKRSQENNFYNYNKLLIFVLSLQNKKVATVNSLFKDLSLKEEEITDYIETLKKENFLTEDDISFLEKINSNFKSKDYKLEIEEIILHLNRIANKRHTISPDTSKRLKILLSTGKYSVGDFKRLHIYFTKTWGADPKMQEYLRPSTLYNTKFDIRIEESRSFFSELAEYEKPLKLICKKFLKLIFMETYPKDRLIGYEQNFDDIFQDIPLSLQTTMIHWIKMGFSEVQIIEVIEGTIENWSSKPELAKHISVSKILDNRFPERAQAVEKLKNKGLVLKSGVSAMENWLNSQKD